MPEIKYCRDCKSCSNMLQGRFLPCLQKRDEEEFEKVRKFLREYPGANMQEVSNSTG